MINLFNVQCGLCGHYYNSALGHDFNECVEDCTMALAWRKLELNEAKEALKGAKQRMKEATRHCQRKDK